MVFGLTLCFFGGTYAATLAAVEAFRTVGGNAQAVAYGEAGWAKVGDATAAPRSNLTALRDALGIEVPRP